MLQGTGNERLHVECLAARQAYAVAAILRRMELLGMLLANFVSDLWLLV